MSQAFSLSVELSEASNEETLSRVNEALQANDSDACTVVSADCCRITQPQHENLEQECRFALVFVPATIVDSALHQPRQGELDVHGLTAFDTQQAVLLSKRLLSMVHPFLAQNFLVRAVIPIRNQKANAPADLVLLDLSHTPPAVAADLLQQTSCQTLHSGPEDAALQILLISNVQFQLSATKEKAQQKKKASCDIPTCPVCLHRIAPWRLGLKTPLVSSQVCSKFCPPPSLLASHSGGSNSNEPSPCSRQRLLRPWPHPAHCSACAVIDHYWRRQDRDEKTSSNGNGTKGLFCYSCALQETLWVCLTCAFVGCGRYSNKHAAEHYRQSGHPYCLELSTLRIWDYVNGEFAHRVDLLECPSSPPLMHPWIPTASAREALGFAASQNDSTSLVDLQQGEAAAHDQQPRSSYTSSLHAQLPNQYLSSPSLIHGLDEKSPKKANMIGEEYEALLQSALEEQAQHYEGEITRLRAALTAEQIDKESISEEERKEIEQRKLFIEQQRAEIEKVGRELLDLQSQEAGHRAASQRLLREQQVAQDLLKKIREESSREQNDGRKQVDELEQQIEDLTANQKMRNQFSQDKELLNAQIFGTTSNEPKSTKKGKKKGRLFRR